MGTRRARTAVVLALLVTATVVAGVGAGTGSGVADELRQPAPTETLGATQVDPDTVLLEADLRADGSAVWTVEYLVRLETQNDSDAFDELAADIEANRTEYTRRFADRIGRTVAGAENSTGRSMAVRDVAVRTGRQDIGQEYGVVEYSFRWTGFATTNATAIAAGDALGGFYLDGDTRLTVSWPDDYRGSVVSPAPAEQTGTTAVWTGPMEFGPGGPTVVVTEGATRQPGGRGDGLPLLVGGLVVLGALVAGLVAYRRGLLGGQGRDDGPAVDDGAGAAAGRADDAGVDEALLSNEERVLRLLEAEGGRIKQQAVARRLDWTDAKTSQVVGSLAEDGEIEKFRIGRENVLALPEESDL